jgi:hypothetical protein
MLAGTNTRAPLRASKMDSLGSRPAKSRGEQLSQNRRLIHRYRTNQASGSADHTIRLWPTLLDVTVTTLCSKLTSNISRQQWHDWISPNIG